MISYKRTNGKDPDFLELTNQLDVDLTITNGNEQAKFAEFNKLDKVNWVVIAYHNTSAIGCGGFKQTDGKAEIKRMFVNKLFRGQKIGEKLLLELENWAQELNIKSAILETGINQKEAQNLYKKLGYKLMANYGPYVNFADSLCMQKQFKQDL